MPTVPVLSKCQVIEPEHDELVCHWRESGGYRCEVRTPHHDDHVISAHTVNHALAGNGYSCAAVDLSAAIMRAAANSRTS